MCFKLHFVEIRFGSLNLGLMSFDDPADPPLSPLHTWLASTGIFDKPQPLPMTTPRYVSLRTCRSQSEAFFGRAPAACDLS